MSEYPLPVSGDVLQRLKEQNSPLLSLASLPAPNVLSEIRQTWAGIEEPVFKRLADAILDIPLKCLSISSDKESYVTFQRWEDGPGATFSIVSPKNDIPDSFRAIFPIEMVEGFEAFLTYFGGLRDAPIEHSGNFLHPQQPLIVSNKDPKYDWGNVGEWEGTLPLYHGGSGDCILIRRDGAIGAWFHESAWGSSGEPPCERMDYTFLELMDHFVHYVRLPEDSEAGEANQSILLLIVMCKRCRALEIRLKPNRYRVATILDLN